MKQIGLNTECTNLENIIEALIKGEETCEIRDENYTLKDVIDFLKETLAELKVINVSLLKHGNTPELIDKVHNKYSELWLFQVNFYIGSLPSVIGRLMLYPNNNE